MVNLGQYIPVPVPDPMGYANFPGPNATGMHLATAQREARDDMERWPPEILPPDLETNLETNAKYKKEVRGVYVIEYPPEA